MTPVGEGPAAGPLDRFSEPELLLLQTARFAQAQLAAALAAIRIAAVRREEGETSDLRDAIRQLEASAECVSLIDATSPRMVQIDHSITRLCRALAQWRLYPGQRTMILNLAAVQLDSETARRLNLVAADLILAAIRSEAGGGSRKIKVILDLREGEITLSVWSELTVPTLNEPCGIGSYCRLAVELIRRAGWKLQTCCDTSGTAVSVTLPSRPRLRATAVRH